MTISIASAKEGRKGARREDATRVVWLHRRKIARNIPPMFIERMDLRSFAVFMLVSAIYLAARWYVRAAGRSALGGVTLGAVGVGVGYFVDPRPTNGLTLWREGLSFTALIGAAVAFALALSQLAGAALFRRRTVRLPFTVLSNDVRIGSASFVAYDRERGVFAGPFVPEPAFETIYPVVRLLSEAYPDVSGPDARRSALDEYLARKDALKLELLDGEGILVPAKEISILDFTVAGGADVFRIDVEVGWEEWERRGLVRG